MTKIDYTVSAWYVLQNLKPKNAKKSSYQILKDLGLIVFTPLEWKITNKDGKTFREEHPILNDLLFVNESREKLDPIIQKNKTIRYKFIRGGAQNEPLIIPNAEMEQFINVVNNSQKVRYYRPDEITPAMFGRKIIMIGGTLDGCKGYLLTTRGSRKKRLFIEIPNTCAISTEVEPEFIQFLE